MCMLCFMLCYVSCLFVFYALLFCLSHFCFKPPWPNGQGVGLLIRRLRVRVPQGVLWAASHGLSPPPSSTRRGSEGARQASILGRLGGKLCAPPLALLEIIAERGFDPRTFGLWAQHASNCATPLRVRANSTSTGA